MLKSGSSSSGGGSTDKASHNHGVSEIKNYIYSKHSCPSVFTVPHGISEIKEYIYSKHSCPSVFTVPPRLNHVVSEIGAQTLIHSYAAVFEVISSMG